VARRLRRATGRVVDTVTGVDAPEVVNTSPGSSPLPPPGVNGGVLGGGLGAEFEPLAPRVRWVWLVSGVISDLIGIAVLAGLVALIDLRVETRLAPWVYPGLVIVAVVVIPLRVLYVRAAYRRWRFRLTVTGVELVHGVLWRRSSAMPFLRLQQVDTTQGPIERALGLTTIHLRSAAATTDATIPGIAPDRVDDLRRDLLARAGRDDGT